MVVCEWFWVGLGGVLVDTDGVVVGFIESDF